MHGALAIVGTTMCVYRLLLSTLLYCILYTVAYYGITHTVGEAFFLGDAGSCSLVDSTVVGGGTLCLRLPPNTHEYRHTLSTTTRRHSENYPYRVLVYNTVRNRNQKLHCTPIFTL